MASFTTAAGIQGRQLGLIMVMVVATGYTQCMPLKLSLGKKDGHVNAIEL